MGVSVSFCAAVLLSLTVDPWLSRSARTSPGGDGQTPREWAIQDLTAREPTLRLAAIVRLGTGGRPEDLALIARFLDSDDDSLRLAAERVLVRAGDQAALARMGAQAGESPTPSRRFEALTVLHESANLPLAARRSAERALGDADPALRLIALEVLSANPSRDSVPAISGVLADSERDVRLAAIAVLGKTPDPRALAPLLEHVDARDHQERIAVIRTLGSLGGIHPRLSAGPAILRHVSDPDLDVQVAAIDALARLAYAPAVPTLSAIAARPAVAGAGPEEQALANGRLARRATLALGRIADASALDALVALLRSAAPREEVVVGLRSAGAAAVEPIVASGLLDEAPSSSAGAAAEILADIGDRRATAPLVHLLRTRPTVAIAAARALGALRDPRAVTALMEAVIGRAFAKASGAREAALRALASVADARAGSVVEAAARDPDPRLRMAGLDLAAAIRGGLSAQTLVRGLGDLDPGVRRAAIRAAAQLTGSGAMPAGFPVILPAVLPAVLPFIRQASAREEAEVEPTTRARLCELLARVGSGPADLALAELIDHDPDDLVRAAAAWAARSRRAARPIAAALERARGAVSPAVAANATLALADARPGAPAVEREGADQRAPALGVRLVTPEGSPVTLQWIRVRTPPSTLALWTRTDEAGEAWLVGLPPGPHRVSLAGALGDQAALTEATASGRSPATTPVAP